MRPIIAILHRGKDEVWKRRYISIVSAQRRAVELAMLEGEPGDVVEFSHATTGVQIGTAKLHVGGSLTLTWNEQELDSRRRICAVVEGFKHG